MTTVLSLVRGTRLCAALLLLIWCLASTGCGDQIADVGAPTPDAATDPDAVEANDTDVVAAAQSIEDAQEIVSEMISRHFRSSVLFLVTVFVLFFVTYGLLILMFRRHPEKGALNTLQTSNDRLAGLAEALLSYAPVEASGRKAVDLAAAIAQHRQEQADATERLERSSRQISSDGIGWLQLVGGSAVIAMLGFLGLQRLETIDTEIDTLRRALFDQMNVLYEQRSKTIDNRIDASLAKSKDTVNDAVVNASSNIELVANQAVTKVVMVEKRINELLEQYPWLEDLQAVADATQIQSLSSVGAAHDLAVTFANKGDHRSAVVALEQITKQKLVGTPADFHNAHAEAMNVKDPSLALDIVELGLEMFTAQFDLTADLAQALISAGRPTEARELLIDLLIQHPDDFARSSRPVVGLTQAVLAGIVDMDAQIEVEQAYAKVLERREDLPNVWTAYAGFARETGRPDEAEARLRQGIVHCPLSQLLHFRLGGTLLRAGKAKEAVEELEYAMRIDYQEQYQHDIDQTAMRVTLAQAYEAAEQPGKALPVYQSTVRSLYDEVLRGAPLAPAQLAMLQYAENRLEALALVQGEPSWMPALGERGPFGQFDAQATIAALRAGNLDLFLGFMDSDYYEELAWSEQIAPLFPDFSLEDEIEQFRNAKIADGVDPELVDQLMNSVPVHQDVLAAWVAEHVDRLTWDADREQYILTETKREN